MRKLLLVLVAAVVASAALAASASASNSWGGYHWARTANPFTITLGDNVSSAWETYLQTAASDWSANTGGNPLNAAVGAGLSRSKRCSPNAGRVEVCDAAYGNNGWLGLATIWLSKGSAHITQGTAKMNDTYYALPKYDTPAWRGAVVCQEVGHTWGLDHQDTSGADFHTCMDYANNPATDNMHPNSHDYQELSIIYNHSDSSTTIGSSAASSTDAGRDAAPTSVTRNDRIKDSTIVERFADGSARVTYITWAIG